MLITPQTIFLKDGRECLLRSPQAEDAAAVLAHLRQTSAETGFMARYPDEITQTIAEEAALLRRQGEDPLALMAAAFVEGELAANAGLTPVARLDKYRHRAEFGISVKEAFWGQGIGSALLPVVIAAARAAGYLQIELEVVAENRRASALYERFGFEDYGLRERSFRFRDGSFCAEKLMILQL